MRYMRLCTPSRPLNEALARAVICARSVTGGRDYRRFVIVGVARTGSTLLLNLLNTQPSVLAFGELFRGDGRYRLGHIAVLSRQSPTWSSINFSRPLEFLDTGGLPRPGRADDGRRLQALRLSRPGGRSGGTRII